jgi:hypothetical protein
MVRSERAGSVSHSSAIRGSGESGTVGSRGQHVQPQRRPEQDGSFLRGWDCRIGPDAVCWTGPVYAAAEKPRATLDGIGRHPTGRPGTRGFSQLVLRDAVVFTWRGCGRLSAWI